MKTTTIVLILLFLVILNVVVFTIIYDNVDSYGFDESLYLAVQIQTSIGLSDAFSHKDLRYYITTQSAIAYILNILLVTYIALIIVKN